MNQHYVPKVYLKQFENSRRMVYTLPNSAHKNSPRIKEVSKAQIAYQPDFYTIQDDRTLRQTGLTDKNVIEKEFNARIENRFEKLIGKLLPASQILSVEDAREVLRMLLSLKQRNPVFRQSVGNPKMILEMFNRRFNDLVEHRPMLEEILKKEGRMGWDEFVAYGRNYMQQFANDPSTPQNMHLEGIIKLHQNEDTVIDEVVRGLLRYKWFIFETTSRWPFVTSDNPGFCVSTKDQVYNLNFGDAAGFIFPLSPKYMLLMIAHMEEQVGNVKTIDRQFANAELVEMINRGTFLVSYKKVISNDENTLHYVWKDMCRLMPHLKDTPKYKRDS